MQHKSTDFKLGERDGKLNSQLAPSCLLGDRENYPLRKIGKDTLLTKGCVHFHKI